MSILLVTYDLNTETDGDDYKEILNLIKTSGSWARLSESSYAVSTFMTPQELYNKAKPFLDENDYFLVLHLSKPYAGRNQSKNIDWLDENLTT